MEGTDLRRIRNRTYFFVALVGVIIVAVLTWLSCGGGTHSLTGGSSPTNGQNNNQSTTTGMVTTNISDPAVCATPNGPYSHVWVTISLVRANLSASATPTGSGWVTLADLTSSPKQIDLLSLAGTQCLLTTLGSTTSLTAGQYQQILMTLLTNSPTAGVATPAVNHCGSAGFNCVVLANGTVAPLDLNSEAQTGIEISANNMSTPSITLAAGQSVDLDIDFNVCASLVDEGNGRFRLKPTLHAGAVSLTQNAINGRVVDNATKQPIPGAQVWAEQQDSSGTDQVVMQTLTGLDGTFVLCPLPSGDYDIVVDALTSPAVGLGLTYPVTVTFKVPAGSATGDIPLFAPSGVNGTSPAVIKGLVTTAGVGNVPAAADLTLWGLQQATPVGASSGSVMVSVALFTAPTATSIIATGQGPNCPDSNDCGSYVMFVPASNPSIGTFSSSGTSYAPPLPGSVSYTVEAQAFVPDGSNQPDCTPPVLTTNLDSNGDKIVVSAGQSVTAQTLAFSGCQGATL